MLREISSFAPTVPARSVAAPAPSEPRDGLAASTASDPGLIPRDLAHTRVHADNGGKIEHLALQLDGHAINYPNVRRNVLKAWEKLFKTMDPDVKFTLVLENQRDRAEVERMLTSLQVPDRERFKLIVTQGLNITMWSRDQMVGLHDANSGQGVLLGQTTMRPHGDDPQVPPLIAEAHPDIRFDPDKRPVTDGGDEVSNNHETFLGYASVYLTAQRLYDQANPGQNGNPFRLNVVPVDGEGFMHPASKLERNPYCSLTADQEVFWVSQAHHLMEEKYGKSVVVVGADDPSTPEVEVPATFHIDMGLTPVDDDTVLVGDPRLAIEILQGLSPEEREQYNEHLRKATGEEGDLVQKLIDANTTDDPLLQHQFDYNAQHMEKLGYAVVRLPYLQGPPGLSWITYNNCLMENYARPDGSEVRRVFLPTFGLPALDDRAEATYREQGFDVERLELPALTAWRGAIRCISNVLDREPK
ncbi:MAG: hypothetical protein AB1758_18455 [Candidatus Eremiobacterota bacterium]